MYGHPYTPYDVQKQFMKALYEDLESKQVAVFESPTGTGKTLSLLCPSVAWLRETAERGLARDLKALETNGTPAWLVENAKKMRIEQFNAERAAHAELMEAAARTIQQQQHSSTQAFPGTPSAKRRRNNPRSGKSSSNGALSNEFLLEDTGTDMGTAVDEALAQFNGLSHSEEGEEDPRLAPLKTSQRIYFASRTHSQLSQVADALAHLKLDSPVRFIALGSRRQLCVHPEVTKLHSVTQMNEKCADLQKHSQCSYRPNARTVRDQAMGTIMDIEDLASFGAEHNSCPYYGAREAVPYAEIVALPYAMLLTRRNREALGIDVKGSVVIIDEAHNLIDTVTSLQSAALTAGTVRCALQGLRLYASRVGARLSPGNRRKIQQIIRLVESLDAYFASSTASPANAKPGMRVDPKRLLEQGNVDTLDIADLSNFIHSSKLVFKVDSYVQYASSSSLENTDKSGSEDRSGGEQQQQQQSSSLGSVIDFLLIATDPAAEGKLFHDVLEEGPRSIMCLRYLVLDAVPAFKEIVEDSRSVVLAGGTMEPMSEFTDYLLPYVQPAERALHSYGHIVPRSQLLVMPLSNIKFTFANRSRPEVVSELGTLLFQIVGETPHGVVAFFPGYKYLDFVVRMWQKAGLFAKLEQKKRVFVESSEAAETFNKYSGHAVNEKGALLLAVVGGRLSEGINFSDDLARAVVMVGLPFPNAFGAEMVAKREFIESQPRHRSAAEAKEAARQYYENLAMRAVNQSVGRAIRHINDYAAIYLVDERYKLKSIQSKLSRWVRESIEEGDLASKTRAFFERNVNTIATEGT